MLRKDKTVGLSEANRLMRSGRLDDAIAAYRQLQQLMPELSGLLAANIEIARRRQASPAAKSRTEAPSPASERKGSVSASALQTPPRPPSPPRPAAAPAATAASATQTGPGSAAHPSLGDLYRQIESSLAGHWPRMSKLDSPLVSVIVTSHNTGAYVEACLESLLSQSYSNLEIFVVDDASTDDTCAIVRRVARGNGGIHLLRLNANLGTYYAKNLGILRSKGQVLFFQDSDDICHPERIALQMQALMELPEASIVRGAYSRVDPDTERVIPVNGLVSKLGLITLGVKREVFDTIGYFNCTTKASDDEFFNRGLRYLGKPAVVNLDLPLYYNTMRDGSLFADMVHWRPDGSIEQKPSAARQAYVETYRQAHSDPDAAKARRRFAFPRIRDALHVDAEMSKLANPGVPVVVSVCSIPEREAKLEIALRSIALQCDRIHVYLDRYEHEPAFLKLLAVPMTVCRSRDRPGLRDNGKFIALEQMLRAGEDAYYLTIDDDIEYPVDYVNALVKALQAHDDAIVVGVHGVTLKDQPRGYFSDRRMVHAFARGLERPRLVNVLGTGTTCFRARSFQGFGLASFEWPGMADLYLALACLQRGIPQLCLARPEGWLKDLGDEETVSLYTEFRGDDRLQARLLESTGPWGLQGVAQTVQRLAASRPELHAKLQSLLPTLRAVTRPAAAAVASP